MRSEAASEKNENKIAPFFFIPFLQMSICETLLYIQIHRNRAKAKQIEMAEDIISFVCSKNVSNAQQINK